MSYRPQIDDERVMRLTRQGMSIPQIAEILGCAERTVSRARKRVGVARPPHQRFTPEQVAIAEQLFDDGCSCAEVARTIDRLDVSVWKRWRHRSWTPQQVAEFAAFCRKSSVKL